MRDDLNVYVGRLLSYWRSGITGGIVSALLTGWTHVGGHIFWAVGVAFVTGTLVVAGFGVWRDERKALAFAEEELAMWRAVPSQEHDLAVEFSATLFQLKRQLGTTTDKAHVVRTFAPVLDDMKERLLPELHRDEALTFEKDYHVFYEWADVPERNAEHMTHVVGWMENKLTSLAARTRTTVPATAAVRKLVAQSQ